LIRQAMAAMAETSCDGAVAAALVPSVGRSLWTGAELMFAEELVKNLQCLSRNSAFFYVFHIGISYIRPLSI
jgi:hypothetical protein